MYQTMGVLDNVSKESPRIGMLIEERCAVGQFADNHLYLIASEDSALAKRAVLSMEEWMAKRYKGELYNEYELEVVPSVELKNHPKLKDRVERYGDNFLIQLVTPASENKRFIVAQTTETRLLTDIGRMVHEAERIAKCDMSEILKSFVKDRPDEFVKLARHAIMDQRFREKYLAEVAERFMFPDVCMAAPTNLLRGRMEVHGAITHKQRMEMYDRFLENLKRYHKRPDPKIEAELDFIISIIDPATLRMFFLKQSPALQERINNYINPQRMAAVSSLDLEVCQVKSIDKTRKNDGHYRLFLKRGYESLMVHFSRKSGFILYLIYLLDRKKNGDKVDTLDISQYKELFGKLYAMVYGVNGETIFTDMMKNYNANNEVHQKGLYTVLKSIRDDVGSTCERMHEPAEPFLLRDISCHLAVLPQHIILPPEIMALI